MKTRQRISILICILLTFSIFSFVGCGTASDKGSSSSTNSSTQSKPETEQEYCYIAIDCKNILPKLDTLDEGIQSLIPSNGIILEKQSVPYSSGDTVYDITKKAAKNHNVRIDVDGSGPTIYVKGLANLFEFDGGSTSGWLFIVDGVSGSKSAGAISVKPGQAIKWRYTIDGGSDI